jgi:hypothetical protein
MSSTLPLLATLLAVLAASSEPDDPPAVVKEAANAYLKAIAAKDVAAITALAGVPWLDRDQRVVREKAALRQAVERALGQMPDDGGKRKVDFIAYTKVRNDLKEADKKLIEEVLGEDGWIVKIEPENRHLSESVILLRVKEGKASVVAGPLKPNQAIPINRIPEVVLEMLDKAETYELLSLEPERIKDGFHGRKILGQTTVKAEAERKRLTEALKLGVENNFGLVAGCFSPRHGLRLTGNGKTVELVICFSCMSIEVYVDGKQGKGFLTTDEPKQAFNAILRGAGVPLAKVAE